MTNIADKKRSAAAYFLLDEMFEELRRRPHYLIAQRSFFTALWPCLSVNTGSAEEAIDKGFARLLDFCDLAIQHNIGIHTGHRLELYDSVLAAQIWNRFLVVDRAYLLASFLLAASIQNHIADNKNALEVVEYWTGQEVASGKTGQIAIADILFGPSWTSLCGDEISNNFVLNNSLLNRSSPPFVFQVKAHKNILPNSTTLPTDMSGTL